MKICPTCDLMVAEEIHTCPACGKEVGNGISREAAERLQGAGVRAIDVGGLGGTSWTLIDSLRSGKDASRYREWGILWSGG